MSRVRPARVVLGQATGNAQTYPGFLVFAGSTSCLPRKAATRPKPETAGFLYAAFRAGDLFKTALGKSPLLPVNVEIYDSAVDPGNLLFRSEARPDASLGDALAGHAPDRGRRAGRGQVLFRPTCDVHAANLAVDRLPDRRGGPAARRRDSLCRAAAGAGPCHRDDACAMSVEKSLKERDLMLQEMKHRIKNSIAKMLAIARQTAASSSSLQDFTSSFMARMQAMAASQDMLTRSQWQKADLGELLRTELEQVFGPNIEKLHLSGPQIELNETATQALGTDLPRTGDQRLEIRRSRQ